MELDENHVQNILWKLKTAIYKQQWAGYYNIKRIRIAAY